MSSWRSSPGLAQSRKIMGVAQYCGSSPLQIPRLRKEMRLPLLTLAMLFSSD